MTRVTIVIGLCMVMIGATLRAAAAIGDPQMIALGCAYSVLSIYLYNWSFSKLAREGRPAPFFAVLLLKWPLLLGGAFVLTAFPPPVAVNFIVGTLVIIPASLYVAWRDSC